MQLRNVFVWPVQWLKPTVLDFLWYRVNRLRLIHSHAVHNLSTFGIFEGSAQEAGPRFQRFPMLQDFAALIPLPHFWSWMSSVTCSTIFGAKTSLISAWP